MGSIPSFGTQRRQRRDRNATANPVAFAFDYTTGLREIALLRPLPFCGTISLMSRVSVFILLICLAAGIGLGVYYGWVVSPVQYSDTDPAALRQSYKDDYILMTAAIYSADGDLAAARAQLETLGVKEPGAAVAEATGRFIKAHQPEADLRHLVLLAIALKTVTPEMQPYLP